MSSINLMEDEMVDEGDKMDNQPDDQTKPILVLGYNFGPNGQVRVIGTKVSLLSAQDYQNEICKISKDNGTSNRADSVDLSSDEVLNRSGSDSVDILPSSLESIPKPVLPIYGLINTLGDTLANNLLDLTGKIVAEEVVPGMSPSLKVFLLGDAKTAEQGILSPKRLVDLTNQLTTVGTPQISGAVASIVRGMFR